MTAKRKKKDAHPAESTIPLAGVGGYVLESEAVVFNAGKPSVALKVRNTGDRPIQVGSHFHFFEANRALEFDRGAAFGMHLDIPSSTAIRFEPGDERTVRIVPFGGARHVYGFNNLLDGAIDSKPARTAAVARMRERGYKSS
ncbi:MAG TPA: urease subunit beta [Casimicrobiaceae bacterium]|nr:urease subunit beta [Casimicrobiaceae bacterium]